MKVKKEVILGAIGGVAGIVGITRIYNRGYNNGVNKMKEVYDCMFDMFREVEDSLNETAERNRKEKEQLFGKAR